MGHKIKTTLLGLWWLLSGAIATGDGLGREADITRLIALVSLAVASYVILRVAKRER